MNNLRLKALWPVLAILAALVLLALPAIVRMIPGQTASVASAQQICTDLTDPANIPAATLINFDDLPNAVVIGDHYRPSFGVAFEDGPLTRAITYGNEPDKAHSKPNVASNDAVSPGTSEGVPMRIAFDEPKTHVGFYVGNGETQQISALMTAYDASGLVICQTRIAIVPEPHTTFMGLYDPEGQIASVSLDYGKTLLSESIDDLYFAPRRGIAPTRTPMPTWTPVPTSTPIPGPSPTPTPVVPMYAYKPPLISIQPILLQPDLSIHGIEITQGIQCFDTSKGLAGCTDNSMPVVNKKDASARIYLKYSSLFGGSQSNVPVRLFIRANNVWYQADASGKATGSINQTNPDSANIYFNVNFTNDVVVDFYAIVDPNNVIDETNEGNNRYPASGYLTLTFHKRDNLNIVGQRLRYHPSGYSGDQYAGGWAVNGGAGDWFEQVLPIRNNGINYTVKSGYLNWTGSLGSGDGQHALIGSLNAQWILENAFAFWFSGAFTGADHVYGWAPNDGYTGGHADMPIYPHAGGFGVVGIGTDNPGTSTDDPKSGALIFGHELVHDYNIYHTNTADACGSNDSNSNFPYSSSSIQEVGFNPFTAKIYNPSNTHDLMSYCPSGGSKLGWIAPFTWNKMYTNLALSQYSTQVETSSQPYVMHPTAAGESLVINATVYNPDLAPEVPGTLGELYRIEGGVAYTLTVGDYAIELRNADGAVLASQPFVVNFLSEYSPDPGAHTGSPEDAPPFPPEPTSKVDVSFIVPWVDGTQSVALVHAGELLDQRLVSNNPPQVLITSPTGEETWNQGETHDVSWQGLDLDGDSLVYNLFYSNNGGADWILLAGDLISPTYPVDVNSMAGGSDVRFRVVATDGINTAVDETDQAITIPNQPPMPTILNPAFGSIVVPGGLVVLQGSATDMEDGTLPDGSLVWSSDRQGELGVGPSVALNSLNPGKHVITLTATDSYGISVQASVQIDIAYPLYIPLIERQ
jgi:hypothetical protein